MAAGLTASAVGCNTADSARSGSAGDACGLKLAFFGALTGSAANLGIGIEQGVELAVQAYNAEHTGCEIDLVKADSQGAPDAAPSLARGLVAEKRLIGVVGPAFSGESIAANPVFDEAGIPLITPSATQANLSEQGWSVFHRALASDSAQGPAAARYIRDTLGPDGVFVVDDQSSYGAGLASAASAELGALVVGADKVAGDGQQADFSATITKIVSSGADVMFYGGYYQNAGLIRKQLTAAGWTGTMVAGDGVRDAGFLTSAGSESAEGTVTTCPCAPASEAGGTFVADYQARWDSVPGTYSDVAFDATNIFLSGVEAGNVTPEAMNEYLDSVDYEGIARDYSFTETGDLDPSKLTIWAYKVVNGEIVPDVEIPMG